MATWTSLFCLERKLIGACLPRLRCLLAGLGLGASLRFPCFLLLFPAMLKLFLATSRFFRILRIARLADLYSAFRIILLRTPVEFFYILLMSTLLTYLRYHRSLLPLLN